MASQLTDFTPQLLKADTWRDQGLSDLAANEYYQIALSAKKEGQLTAYVRAIHLAAVALKSAVAFEPISSRRQTAVTYFETALKTAKELGLIKEQAAILSDWGDLASAAGEDEVAISHFNESNQLAQELKNTELQAANLKHLSQHYRLRHQLDEAKQAVDSAEQLLREQPTSGFLFASILLERASIEYVTKQFSASQDTAEQALSWYVSEGRANRYWLRLAQLYGLLEKIALQLQLTKETNMYQLQYQSTKSRLQLEVAKQISLELGALD